LTKTGFIDGSKRRNASAEMPSRIDACPLVHYVLSIQIAIVQIFAAA
jgi:hypothetical protein